MVNVAQVSHMPALANVNGQMQPLSEVRISALDRGFLFGDAVYEVLRVYRGKPWLLDEHLKRLAVSLAAIRITGVDLERLRRRMLDTITAGPFREALVYIQVTRGAAPTRSHAFPQNVTPLELLFVEEFEDHYVEQREHGAAAITYADLRWSRCDIKSTILLGNVLAAQAAKEAGVAEALLYLPDGTLVEGSKTSLFAVFDGVLRTAPVSQDILPGITRGFVLKLAEEQHYPVKEQAINRNGLSRISELFLTGTTSEVLPLVRVDQQTIGDGKPGPVARQLQKEFQSTVRKWLQE
jgi:D-alanine transaminase